MEAVLYVTHGTRKKEGIEAVYSFLMPVMAQMKCVFQKICFLQFSNPTLSDGIEACVKEGVSKIIIVPLLLLKADHATNDIPFAIKKAKRKYPWIQFVYEDPLGEEEKVIESLYEELVKKQFLQHATKNVLLVGRGGRLPSVKTHLVTISSKLQEKLPEANIEICFLYGLAPHFDDIVHASTTKNRYVLPFLLFDGKLYDLLKETARKKGWIVCNTLGKNRHMQQIVKKRVNRWIVKNDERGEACVFANDE